MNASTQRNASNASRGDSPKSNSKEKKKLPYPTPKAVGPGEEDSGVAIARASVIQLIG